MTVRLRKLFANAAGTFWLLPAFLLILALLLAIGCVELDRSGVIPGWMIDNAWVYNGGGTGARTLLGAVAASSIGVASTVFSITIAALSLAAGQMGPRLLRNFVRDRGNQFTLGTLLGTFVFALMVLRSVRTIEEGEFIPHLSLTVAVLLAFCSVGMLIYFVGHIAGRINVDTVVDLVTDDVNASLRRLKALGEDSDASDAIEVDWSHASVVRDSRDGYLQHLDEGRLADWASAQGTAIRLLVRPGEHVFSGAPIALMVPAVPGAEEAIRGASALGSQRASSADFEQPVRQLVEVAVRALSPGINDPFTAISVLDRLGASLCSLARVKLPAGTYRRQGRVVLRVPVVHYDGLVDAMLNLIRQNAHSQPIVLVRIIEVLTAVLSSEPDSTRQLTLERHADLVLSDGERVIATAADLDHLRRCHDALLHTRTLRLTT